jgi:phytoene desaturase
VEQIVTEQGSGGRVKGVRLAGGELIVADVVVCNADLPDAYQSLLPQIEAPRVVRRGTYSPSAVVWHVGVRGSLPAGAAHHNVHFGHAWDEAFRALLGEGRRMPDPSLLVSVPTIDEPAMAPPGRHSLYVLEPVPNLAAAADWSDERVRTRDDLERKIKEFGYPTEIEVEALVDPTDWRAQGLHHGTPFGLAHHFLQSGPFRPRNVERRAPGLVFVGSSTVPGVGVPMVIISGELAAQRVASMDVGR